MVKPKKIKVICNILSNDNERRIFHFREGGDGSIYVKIKIGLQVGIPPNHKTVQIYRISIHPTHESPLFNTIKSHLEFSDGTNDPEIYLRTDAIKADNKFAHITSFRLSDLKDQIYDLKSIEKGFQASTLGKFNPRRQVPLISLLVGGKDAKFDFPINSYLKKEIVSTNFKIIILTTFWTMPASDFCDCITSITSGKTLYDDNRLGEERHFCNSLTNDECIPIIKYLNTHLMINYLEINLLQHAQTLNSKITDFLNKMLKDLNGIAAEMEPGLAINFTIINNNRNYIDN